MGNFLDQHNPEFYLTNDIFNIQIKSSLR